MFSLLANNACFLYNDSTGCILSAYLVLLMSYEASNLLYVCTKLIVRLSELLSKFFLI